jgi:hypothetical protein
VRSSNPVRWIRFRRCPRHPRRFATPILNRDLPDRQSPDQSIALQFPIAASPRRAPARIAGTTPPTLPPASSHCPVIDPVRIRGHIAEPPSRIIWPRGGGRDRHSRRRPRPPLYGQTSVHGPAVTRRNGIGASA